MKYKVSAKDCRMIVTVKASSKEQIDEKALDVFARMCPRGFLRPRLVKKNLVEYSGPVGITLFERLQKPMTKRDFLFIMEQILVAAQKVISKGLILGKLVMDNHYIYINEHTKEMQFLYIPTVSELPSGGLKALMETIIYSSAPALEPDMEYIARFAYVLRTLRVFDLNALEAHIAREDRSVVMTIRKQNVGQSGFMTSKQMHYLDHRDQQQQQQVQQQQQMQQMQQVQKPVDDAQDEKTGLLEEDENTGLLEEDENTSLLAEDEEGTALLEEKKEEPRNPPKLIRKQSGEAIVLNRSVFRLGKQGGPADYTIPGNIYISKNHADIITRGDSYFVVDLESKNHTYLNGQMLQPKCETRLEDGDCLVLANEEFTFRLEQQHRTCPQCGKVVAPTAKFCVGCGCRL